MFKPARLFVVSAACWLIAASTAAAVGRPLPAPSAGPAGIGLGVPTLERPAGVGGLFAPSGLGFGSFGSGSFGSALVGAARTGIGPSEVAVNAATHTLYVANGSNDNGPNPTGNTVSVIDTRSCRAQDVSRCKGPWPTITVGNLPSSIAIDRQTDTVYVANFGDATVSVFDGATCRAQDTSGCRQTPATVPVGLKPIGIVADPANHTVYVPNSDNGAGDSTTVSMIDSATCNATDLSGCPTTQPPTVNVGAAPLYVDVNRATHTAYVTTIGAQNGWSVFDASTCNATVQSGCGAIGILHGDPAGPNAGVVDAGNQTLYTANYGDTLNFHATISAFDLRHCNAGDLAGCATQTPGTVMPLPSGTYDFALYVAVDVPLHSVYVSYQNSGALFVVDTNICNGSRLAACSTLRPPAISTGDEPEGIVIDKSTQTLYAANQADNTASVIEASRCNAQVTSGCRRAPPTVPISDSGMAADPAVNTLYVASGAHTVSMVNTRTCNESSFSGCAGTPPQFTAGAHPGPIAVDRRTHTIYVSNFGSFSRPGPGTVSVIDASTCKATDSTGCAHVHTLRVPGGNPTDIAVNAATDTVYVATATDGGPNLLSVFDGATCNAINFTNCHQTPATLALGDSGGAFGGSMLNIAVNAITNTIYATNVVMMHQDAFGDTVYVVNGATCDAADTAGCNQTPATITTSPVPWGLAVDQATNTVYVANWTNDGKPATVSVIDGANCDGANTSGCGDAPAVVPAGFGAVRLAIDPTTHKVYTANFFDSSVSVIDGESCDRFISFGCSLMPPKREAGETPYLVTVDPAVGTAYVANLNGIAVIPLAH